MRWDEIHRCKEVKNALNVQNFDASTQILKLIKFTNKLLQKDLKIYIFISFSLSFSQKLNWFLKILIEKLVKIVKSKNSHLNTKFNYLEIFKLSSKFKRKNYCYHWKKVQKSLMKFLKAHESSCSVRHSVKVPDAVHNCNTAFPSETLAG
jgi:hypothetical protein